jgi:2-oxo-4-hydroxy-4-carboxy-5-ureidoimidazoline decarboxylase
MDVSALDALPEAEARALLAACCAAPAWVDGMLAARPWRDRETLLAAADRAWDACPAQAVDDAIAHHPRLGERAAKAPLGEREQRWSALEQKGAGVAAEDAREALARGNVEYEARFGHTFILCATGVSAEDMLRALRERLVNTPAAERAITARELHKITRLRLERLLAGDEAPREAR